MNFPLLQKVTPTIILFGAKQEKSNAIIEKYETICIFSVLLAQDFRSITNEKAEPKTYPEEHIKLKAAPTTRLNMVDFLGIIKKWETRG